ncbi:strawberry notch-like NTP hydrolase domain-containing protein [Allosphingosinicella indica]|uniref:Predicted RNA methylase n=1 Tax=Allosphingosinicella indica TaxID=941907 RepID=A0A1X7FYI6_9SPHN|nr:strawberry notch family protein [Allosphingosinicella indica]SMF61184.1 Predicted RNA methylase [Allosphingosinicella indica]
MASVPLLTDNGFTSSAPHVEAAYRLRDLLKARKSLDRRDLSAVLAAVAGASDADAAYNLREAYDALELGVALLLASPEFISASQQPRDVLATLRAFASKLPVQSFRSERQVALQQFSTPLGLAYLASRAARLHAADLVLEPSAGNGLLAWPAHHAGCNLLLNEICPRRTAGLRAAFPEAKVFPHDAELIDDLLDPVLRPDVVLMNPPFARSLGRGADRHAAARHLVSAFARLREGGRLVAIMPENYRQDGDCIAASEAFGVKATTRLDALIARGPFLRHGTGVAVRLLVIDKAAAGANASPIAADSLDHLCELIEALPARERAVQSNEPRPTARSCRRLPTFCASAPKPQAAPSRAIAGGDVEALRYSVLVSAAAAADAVGQYLPYRPSRIRFAGAAAHPTPLVESLAMGAISAPPPAYVPHLPRRLVAEGLLSDAQLETLIYAGTAFDRDLPGTFACDDGCTLQPDAAGQTYRLGFFLGDGTGAGKGRQVAGVILDRWLRGESKHIWISKNEALLEDARRDWSALGGLPMDIQPLSAWKIGATIHHSGILFVTYPTLRSGRGDATRLAQILEWAGTSFEGVIAFDEAHAMANAAGGEGKRGAVKGSEQGIAGIRLQNSLARARVLYASATGASDINNLAYAARLGLWGAETAFADRAQFVASIRSGGIAAMELVARDLKALGLYTARALSFAGVEYDVLEHRLTGSQIAVYDAYADAWAIIHNHLDAALAATRVVDAATGDTLNPQARSAAISRFESVKQRFFAQLLLAMKLPTLLSAIDADLAAGNSVVIQLVSTGEAMLARRLADLDPAERASLAIDPSPREYVIDYLAAAFPTRLMNVFTDAEGNQRSEPMSDAEGRPVHCQAAVRSRDDLIERLCALPPIATALDRLVEIYGTAQVAEVTGRTQRLIIGSDGAQKVERRGAGVNLAEAQAFMRGDKRILVFSDAGGTGRSYHADLDAANQQRRIHYLLEPGWRADAAIQGLGRTHRTRQAAAPLFRPVTTDVRGERRFISTIARRLDAMGALTRGQRQTGGQNLFDPADNLESPYAREALLGWYRLLHRGKLRSIALTAFEAASGLRLTIEGGALREDLPPIQRWLNRLLAFRITLQNAIFDEFLSLVEARVAAARGAGTLDIGVETLAVEDFHVLDDRLLRTDAKSGATTHLLRLEARFRQRPVGLAGLERDHGTRAGMQRLVNSRSGKAALRIPARSFLSDEGTAISRVALIRPLKREYLTSQQLAESCWEPASDERFATAWAAEAEAIAATPRTEVLHLATGLLLPVWDKLPEDHLQVIRIAADDGRSLLGRAVPEAALAQLAARLGLDLPESQDAASIVRSVLAGGAPLPLQAGSALVVKRSRVNDNYRLELTGFDAARLGWFKAQGCFTEIIRYQTRLFVPVTGADAVLTRLAA